MALCHLVEVLSDMCVCVLHLLFNTSGILLDIAPIKKKTHEKMQACGENEWTYSFGRFRVFEGYDFRN